MMKLTDWQCSEWIHNLVCVLFFSSSYLVKEIIVLCGD